ncbi:hypothetical protein RRG08_014390 [Elysia crispata]|uniref:Secreted protein n=1 Tax=Elysia crispata TaxID=231223 RepID=A0AAE0YNL4_9GAST|nr:hypothetical protein RRG08_014390 [Elysia crispata]
MVSDSGGTAQLLLLVLRTVTETGASLVWGDRQSLTGDQLVKQLTASPRPGSHQAVDGRAREGVLCVYTGPCPVSVDPGVCLACSYVGRRNVGFRASSLVFFLQVVSRITLMWMDQTPDPWFVSSAGVVASPYAVVSFLFSHENIVIVVVHFEEAHLPESASNCVVLHQVDRLEQRKATIPCCPPHRIHLESVSSTRSRDRTLLEQRSLGRHVKACEGM